METACGSPGACARAVLCGILILEVFPPLRSLADFSTVAAPALSGTCVVPHQVGEEPLVMPALTGHTDCVNSKARRVLWLLSC